MTPEPNEASPFYQLGASVAALVFAPDYYEGPWLAIWGARRRRCRNYATATAWARYLRRQGHRDLWTMKDTSR